MNDCYNCAWLSDMYVSVCCNAQSDHCADFVSVGDRCQYWEEGTPPEKPEDWNEPKKGETDMLNYLTAEEIFEYADLHDDQDILKAMEKMMTMKKIPTSCKKEWVFNIAKRLYAMVEKGEE